MEPAATEPRQSRQQARRRQISEAVMSEGAIRIETLADRFGISLMTVHRDLDQLASQGFLKKSRGVATALSTTLVESSDVYRSGLQIAEKRAIGLAAIEHIEPGQSLFLDDSTTILQVAKLLHRKTPLTVITNVLTLMNTLHDVQGISLVALGGNYYAWCSAFMGRMTNTSIASLRADVAIMSTAAITDGICFHQRPETVDTKRAMLDSAARRILLVDHTKFAKRALHALGSLTEFDLVIVDWLTPQDEIDKMVSMGISVVRAPEAASQESDQDAG